MPAITASSNCGDGSDFATTRSDSLAAAVLLRIAAMLAFSRARSITSVGRISPARFSAADSPAK